MDDAAKFSSKPISEVLSQHAEFAFLMGSAGTEKFHKESDIDIAVFWKKSCTQNQTQMCHQLLIKVFNRDVDLVPLNNIDTIFARQVLETGRIVFSNSAGTLLNWKRQMLSNYPDFKYSRKIIEENILNRKKYV